VQPRALAMLERLPDVAAQAVVRALPEPDRRALAGASRACSAMVLAHEPRARVAWPKERFTLLAAAHGEDLLGWRWRISPGETHLEWQLVRAASWRAALRCAWRSETQQHLLSEEEPALAVSEGALLACSCARGKDGSWHVSVWRLLGGNWALERRWPCGHMEPLVSGLALRGANGALVALDQPGPRQDVGELHRLRFRARRSACGAERAGMLFAPDAVVTGLRDDSDVVLLRRNWPERAIELRSFPDNRVLLLDDLERGAAPAKPEARALLAAACCLDAGDELQERRRRLGLARVLQFHPGFAWTTCSRGFRSFAGHASAHLDALGGRTARVLCFRDGETGDPVAHALELDGGFACALPRDCVAARLVSRDCTALLSMRQGAAVLRSSAAGQLSARWLLAGPEREWLSVEHGLFQALPAHVASPLRACALGRTLVARAGARSAAIALEE
jgi:hypothetical protein